MLEPHRVCQVLSLDKVVPLGFLSLREKARAMFEEHYALMLSRSAD